MTPDRFRQLCRKVKDSYESGLICRIRATRELNQLRASAYDELARDERGAVPWGRWQGIEFCQVDETAALDDWDVC